jgi:hypothetical protein
MPASRTGTAPWTLLADALLVERIAALSDRAALAELDARHGMTLYAIAYGLMLEGEAADRAVASAFRGVWRCAASFDPRSGTVRRWLVHLTREAARARQATDSDPSVPLLCRNPSTMLTQPVATVAPTVRAPRRAAGWARLAWVAATLVVPAILARFGVGRLVSQRNVMDERAGGAMPVPVEADRRSSH